MHESSSERRGGEDHGLERAIVLLLLSGDGQRAQPFTQLARELGADPQTLERALQALSRTGVVELEGSEARASSATRRIDELGLIAI